MEGLIENWRMGIGYLLSDEKLNSFYTYFTIIFAECAYLWSHFETSTAIAFTVILLLYLVNVLVFGYLKGEHEGTRLELGFSVLYVIVFVAIHIVGCCINFWLNFLLTVVPFAVTAVFVMIRESQSNYVVHTEPVLLFTSQLLIVVGPYATFFVAILNLPTCPGVLKAIILILYLLCIPFIPVLEDELSGYNIFEMAYEVSYHKK